MDMDKHQHKILEETEPFQASLALQMVGRKLRVSGKTEKKQEDGKGSYSYSPQEFRQEFDLPEGLNPEAVTCCMDPDKKLHIQATEAPRVENTADCVFTHRRQQHRLSNVNCQLRQDTWLSETAFLAENMHKVFRQWLQSRYFWSSTNKVLYMSVN
ncbi:hypothetical protein Q8A73_019929 [Channa argus]|nr:hypothetical protein Q8A73_019929 [Channa argus]